VMLNSVAAKAVCLGEAMRPDFHEYATRVLGNAQRLGATLVDRGVDVLSGGTDTPIVLVDLRPLGITGAAASDALEAAGLTANKNGVPGDTQPPTITSGLRFGSSAGTARGFGVEEFDSIGNLIADVLDSMSTGDETTVAEATRRRVSAMTEAFPIY